MYLTPAALLALREFDAPTFQTLVSYTGSRARAIATALAVLFRGKDADGFWEFVSAFQKELTSFNVLLGFAVSLHGPEQIRPPQVLRMLTRTMARQSLHDFDTLRAVVESGGDPDDTLLPCYAGDWWSKFDPRTADKIRQSPSDIVSHWEVQRKTLPSIKRPLTAPLEFNVGVLTGGELRLAWTIASDAVALLDGDIERSLTALADVTGSLLKHNAMLKDLKVLEERLIEDEISELRRSG